MAAVVLAPSGWSLAIIQVANGTRRLIGPADGTPAWSPDGRFVAYEQPGGLTLLDVGAGRARLLGPASADRVAWSPDSAALAANTEQGLLVIGLDGTTTAVLTGTAGSPAWSPLGTWLASERAGDVWLVRADGSDAHELRPHAIAPAWAPAGLRLAAVLTDRGDLVGGVPAAVGDRGELGLLSLDGSASGLGVLAVATEAWSPDGRWIAYSVDNGNGEGLEAARADGGRHLRVAEGCAPPNAPRLAQCGYFGGLSVPVDTARRPLTLRLAAQEARKSRVTYDLGLRDARHNRVRDARIQATAAPAGAATIRLLEPATLDTGVLYLDVTPRGRTPARSVRITVTVRDTAGRIVAKRTFA